MREMLRSSKRGAGQKTRLSGAARSEDRRRAQANRKEQEGEDLPDPAGVAVSVRRPQWTPPASIFPSGANRQ